MNQNPTATLDNAFASASQGLYADNTAFLADFATNGAAFINGFDLANADTGAVGCLDVDGEAVKTAATVVPNVVSRSGTDVLTGFAETYESVARGGSGSYTLAFQVGADVGATISTTVGAVNLGALALDEALDVVNRPVQVIAAMDRALEHVNSERSRIGAQMVRLETVINSLNIATENLSASRARVQDADFAAETANLSRAQILQQAGTAMVAQANQAPSNGLTLLR